MTAIQVSIRVVESWAFVFYGYDLCDELFSSFRFFFRFFEYDDISNTRPVLNNFCCFVRVGTKQPNSEYYFVLSQNLIGIISYFLLAQRDYDYNFFLGYKSSSCSNSVVVFKMPIGKLIILLAVSEASVFYSNGNNFFNFPFYLFHVHIVPPLGRL